MISFMYGVPFWMDDVFLPLTDESFFLMWHGIMPSTKGKLVEDRFLECVFAHQQYQ